jgi:phospholipid/cholesterol/gamma-HCH transport system permease protein
MPNSQLIVTGQKIKTFIKKQSTFIENLGQYVHFSLKSLKLAFTNPPEFALTLKQLYEVGVSSLPVVAVTGLSSGLVLAAQSFFQLGDKGMADVTGLVVTKAMMTELGPVLSAFMVTGRVGAAICAEIGSMKVSEQIDALESMAVSPIRYLIVPRLISGIFMMPLLTIFGIVMGVIGGYIVAVHLFNMSGASFFDPISASLTLFDLFIGLIKAFVFGFFIMSVSCFKGLHTNGGAAGVGRSTTNSVVVCYCCILLSNFFMTMGLNLLYRTFVRLL